MPNPDRETPVHPLITYNHYVRVTALVQIPDPAEVPLDTQALRDSYKEALIEVTPPNARFLKCRLDRAAIYGCPRVADTIMVIGPFIHETGPKVAELQNQRASVGEIILETVAGLRTTAEGLVEGIDPETQQAADTICRICQQNWRGCQATLPEGEIDAQPSGTKDLRDPQRRRPSR